VLVDWCFYGLVYGLPCVLVLYEACLYIYIYLDSQNRTYVLIIITFPRSGHSAILISTWLYSENPSIWICGETVGNCPQVSDCSFFKYEVS
jgi:hypothetical protein